MINFAKAPTETLYHPIQNNSFRIGEKDVAHIFARVRFDARLMEVTTEFLRDYWWNLDPQLLNHQMKLSKYPYTIKPSILAILRTCAFPNEKTKDDFFRWCQLVVRGIKDPSPQLFYIGLNKIGSKSMRREEDEALECFTEHHLIAKDLPFNKGFPGTVKTAEDFAHRTHFVEAKKSECALEIRRFKMRNGFTNKQVMEALQINRVFLSRILNNRLDGITLDYLGEKVRLSRS